MHLSPSSPLVLGLLASNTLALTYNVGCGDQGCISLLVKNLPAMDVTAYKEDFKSRVTTLSVSTYRSPLITALVRPFHSADETVDPSIPPICRPSRFRNYRSFVDKRKFDKRSQESPSKSDCCVHCHAVGDCFAYEFDPFKQQCNVYVTTEKFDIVTRTETCPAGKGVGYLELPNYPIWPNHYGHEPGPCLRDAEHLHKMGHGIDTVGYKDSPDQAVLNAQRDASQMSDDDEDVDEYDEL